MDLNNEAAAGTQGGEDASGFFGGSGNQAGNNGGGDGTGDGAGDGSGTQGGGEGAQGAGADGQSGDQGAAEAAWLEQFSAEAEGDKPSIRDWIKSTNVKDLTALARMARDNQAAVRETGRIKVPGEDASDEERAAFFKAIGVPEKAEDYTAPELKGEDGKELIGPDGQPIKIDQARFEEIATLAHKHGIPKATLESLMHDLTMNDLQRYQTMESDMQAEVDAHVKAWGDKKSENMANVTAATRELGLTRDEQKAIRAALGAPRALDLFADLGSRIGEDTMAGQGMNGKRSFGMSPAQAQSALDAKKADVGWRTKALTPGTAEHAEYERLLKVVGDAADAAAPAG